MCIPTKNKICTYESRGPSRGLWLSKIIGRAKSRLRPSTGPGLAQLLASGRSRHITTSGSLLGMFHWRFGSTFFFSLLLVNFVRSFRPRICCILLKLLSSFASAWKSGHKTGKRPLTGPDFNRNGPDRGHSSSIFENKRPEKTGLWGPV